MLSSTPLQGQKEGIGKKKSVMPSASRFRIWLWIYNFVQGDFFFQNSVNFGVARPGLPETSHLFLDLSSEQKLSCNRESELSFAAQVRSQTGRISWVNMETSWWCHSGGAECYNNVDWWEIHKSFSATPLAHKQGGNWRVSRNLGISMTFEALFRNCAFKNRSNWSVFVEQQWGTSVHWDWCQRLFPYMQLERFQTALIWDKPLL